MGARTAMPVEDLGLYLAEARACAWQWHEHDCCSFPARWAGIPLPDYSNEQEAEAMLRAAGGLVPLWERAAVGRAAEIDPLDRRAGDVGVIELLGPSQHEGVDIEVAEVGAIWTGIRWAFVPARGGVAATSAAHCLKAWRPLCRR